MWIIHDIHVTCEFLLFALHCHLPTVASCQICINFVILNKSKINDQPQNNRKKRVAKCGEMFTNSRWQRESTTMTNYLLRRAVQSEYSLVRVCGRSRVSKAGIGRVWISRSPPSPLNRFVPLLHMTFEKGEFGIMWYYIIPFLKANNIL